MREIRFRSWLPEFNKMVYGHIGWLNKKKFTGDALYEKDLELQNLMQFTGLKDMNGKEIYEGDIVRTPDGDTKVQWWKAGFYFKFLENKGRGDWVEIDTSKSEIIDNIYENNELLP